MNMPKVTQWGALGSILPLSAQHNEHQQHARSCVVMCVTKSEWWWVGESLTNKGGRIGQRLHSKPPQRRGCSLLVCLSCISQRGAERWLAWGKDCSCVRRSFGYILRAESTSGRSFPPWAPHFFLQERTAVARFCDFSAEQKSTRPAHACTADRQRQTIAQKQILKEGASPIRAHPPRSEFCTSK